MCVCVCACVMRAWVRVGVRVGGGDHLPCLVLIGLLLEGGVSITLGIFMQDGVNMGGLVIFLIM